MIALHAEFLANLSQKKKKKPITSGTLKSKKKRRKKPGHRLGTLITLRTGNLKSSKLSSDDA